MPELKLPQAGKSAVATVRKWRKKQGDPVAKGDVLLEIETDEGLAEVESSLSGQLATILVGEGKTVPVNTPIAILGAENRGQKQASEPASPVKEVKVEPAQAPPAPGKVTPIVMPKAGQSMEEGVLVKWYVKPGDTIKQGQVIFEIETDKATMDVEATDAGRLAKIILAEGGTCKVLQPVAFLAANDADVEALLASGAVPVAATPAQVADAPAQAPPSPAQAAGVATAVVADSGRVKASPAARKISTALGIDLHAVGAGSGPGGRILSTDVQAASAALKQAPQPAPIPAAVPAAVPGPEGAVRRKMTQMRRAIAKNLAISKQTIPHFYIKTTINADALYTFYQAEKAKYPCSLNDVVVMATARCIREFAPFRSRIEGDDIIEFPSVNIGIAVGMDEGLVVPVLVNADRLTLRDLAVESKRIANTARAGKIEGMNKGLFTITNMGMFGVEEFNAIINPPESAILSVGAIREDVIVSGGTLRPGRVMTLTLSVDHRVIDGTLAARFLAKLKELLEWPAQLIQ